MSDKASTRQAYWAVVIALIAVCVAGLSLWSSRKAQPVPSISRAPAGMLARIEREGVLHAGYGVYPPYTMEDPNTKEVSGFSVDIIKHVAAELKCKVEWHRLNWNTMAADLKRGDFDVIADPIFQTIPRAREFAFSEPYSYFADGIAVVKVGESRFTDFASVDRRGIQVAVGQGWASETLVKSRFTRATVKPVQTTTDLLQVFNEVLSGRADVAIADGADAVRFVGEHPTEVRALWLDDPPAFMPAGFALRTTDTEGAQFLSVCIRNLEATGVLEEFAKRHGVTTSRDRKHKR